MIETRSCHRRVLLLLLAGTAGCGGGLTLPGDSNAGVDLSVVGGNGQSGTVGQALALPIVVQVADSGHPLPGRLVAFVLSGGAGAGRVEPDTVLTGANGQAATRWVLGTVTGGYSGAARLVTAGPDSAPAVGFAAFALPGAPDTVRAVSDTNLFGRRGQQLDAPLVVVVVDRYGNTVPGATVEWTVNGNSGELSDSETTTGTDGTTSVTWTLADRPGEQKVMASVAGASGLPVTFTAFVLF